MVIGMHTHTHTDDLGGPSYRTAAGVPTKGLPHDSRKASLGLHAKMVLTSPSLPPHTHPLTSSTNPPHPSDPTLSPPPTTLHTPVTPPSHLLHHPPSHLLHHPPSHLLHHPPSHFLHHPSAPHPLTSTTPPHPTFSPPPPPLLTHLPQWRTRELQGCPPSHTTAARRHWGSMLRTLSHHSALSAHVPSSGGQPGMGEHTS